MRLKYILFLSLTSIFPGLTVSAKTLTHTSNSQIHANDSLSSSFRFETGSSKVKDEFHGNPAALDSILQCVAEVGNTEKSMVLEPLEETVPAATVREHERMVYYKEEPEHRFALMTNILYYGILMPNLEFEWRINPKWSVSLEGDVAWYKKASKHKYYQIAVISPEVRRWFKTRKPWHGMYVGAFLQGTWYDLENGHKGHKGEGGSIGLSYGYMFPISRCLSFDAEIGVGYFYTRHREYVPYDGHYIYQRTKQTSYFGPLKAKFSFVWRFGDKNRKGGDR